MRRTELAEQLVAARTRNERKRLLREKAHLADLRLAFQIKEICYAHWATEPSIARRASVVLKELADAVQSPEVLSIALWVEGIAHITLGKLDDAINLLDRSARGFRKLGKDYEAAQTGVAKLMALAFLGRYDAAIRTGKRSLEVFEAEGDIFGSGRVELNLANLYSKLEMHSVSEKYGLSARRRFVRCGSTKWKIMAENGLAITYANLGDFAAARRYYEQALAAARQAKMLVTEAEVEASLGDLESMTGNFAEAVRHLERSRQKFLSIDVQHNSAVADLEIAASYLQLNLIAEAVVILDRTAPSLRKLKLKPEEARARVLLGRAMARTGRGNAAVRQFQIAEALFETIENRIGLALTRLEHAQVELRQGRVEEAATLLRLAETSLRSTENPRHKLLARWTLAELASQRKKPWQAQRLLREILAEAQHVSSSELVISASNALGEIALANGDIRSAKDYFDRAVTLLDKTSGTLISDEFRVAFSGLAARPFENLTKIVLAEGLIGEAFAITERSKAQALSDTIRGDRSRVASNGPIGLSKRAEELREELNWVYSRQARYADASRSTLDRRRRRLERELASIARQIDSLAGSRKAREQGVYLLDVDKLIAVCRRKKAAIIEFCQIDASFSAFVISGEGIRVVADLASDTEVTKWLDQLMFQFASFRYGRSLPTAVEDPLKKEN